jgi:hypothetical protein
MSLTLRQDNVVDAERSLKINESWMGDLEAPAEVLSACFKP